MGACCEVVAPWWGSQCHSSGLIIQDMEVSVGTRYFHPHVNPEPRGVLLFPEGLDVYADGPVGLISGQVWGPHCPLRGGPGIPGCLLPSYQVLALQSSTLGSVEELVDGFTYSISLDLGQAVYTPGPRSTPGNRPGPSLESGQQDHSRGPGTLFPGAPRASPCSHPRGLGALR